MTRKAAIVFALLSGVPLAPIGAHPGRTDAQGCHNERATGHRHCHGGITAAAAIKPELPGWGNGAGVLSMDISLQAAYVPCGIIHCQDIIVE